MTNIAAAKFLKQIIAAFCRYPPTADTKQVYLQKLSRWKLTQQQWDDALEILTNNSNIDDLPLLAEIYPVLKAQTDERKPGSNLASVHFDMPDGYHYVERVMSVDSVWVYYPLVLTGPKGIKIELRPEKVGKAFIPPEGATNIETFPDKPARPAVEDLPSPGEIQELMQEGAQP